MRGKGGWVVAVCAIVLSITGSATAAKLITGKQIKNNSLTGQDVKNGSLASADLSAGARDALKGNVGPAGPAGAPGPQGPAGPVNTAKATKVVATAAVAPGQTGSAAAFCPSGQNAVMGNWFGSIAHTAGAGMNNERTSYFLVVGNNSSITVSIEATAWCVPSGSAVSGRSSRESTQEQIEGIVARVKADRARAKGSAVKATASKACSSGWVHARLPWGHKCLRRGQYCKTSGDSSYHKYGYHCHTGRLR